MKTHSRFLLAALSAALLSLPSLRAADVPADGPGGGRGEGWREMRREKMGEHMGARIADELGLTAEQKAKMKELGQAEKAELKALRESLAPAIKEGRAKAQAIHKAYMEKRQALMTPEQREKAGKMREKMERRREHREMHREMDHEKPDDKK